MIEESQRVPVPKPPASARPRSSTSNDTRALRSAGALRDALLALLETTAFDRITIRDIARRAGIHYATFFRHHASRESLLEDIARDEIRHIVRLTLASRGTDDYEAGFLAVCHYVDDHRALWSTLLNGGAGPAMREEWKREASEVTRSEQHADTWLPRQLGAVCAASLIAETLAWWLAQPPGSHSAEQISAILLRLLTALMENPLPRS